MGLLFSYFVRLTLQLLLKTLVAAVENGYVIENNFEGLVYAGFTGD
ncbi:hypothetical protein [Methanobrevibacter sp.]|nr:hypothetical protein [Methanobrevibacter sp.]MDO5823600.1 hypothetical protein [Methanobrevibacter sp.]